MRCDGCQLLTIGPHVCALKGGARPGVMTLSKRKWILELYLQRTVLQPYLLFTKKCISIYPTFPALKLAMPTSSIIDQDCAKKKVLKS